MTSDLRPETGLTVCGLLLRVQTKRRRQQQDETEGGSAERAPSRLTLIYGAPQERNVYRPHAKLYSVSPVPDPCSSYLAVRRKDNEKLPFLRTFYSLTGPTGTLGLH